MANQLLLPLVHVCVSVVLCPPKARTFPSGKRSVASFHSPYRVGDTKHRESYAVKNGRKRKLPKFGLTMGVIHGRRFRTEPCVRGHASCRAGPGPEGHDTPLGALLEKPQQHGANHRGGLVGNIQLVDGIPDMEVHRVLGQQQYLGNVLRRFAVGRPAQHLQLAFRQ